LRVKEKNLAKEKPPVIIFVTKIFFITLFLSASFSVVSLYLTNNISVEFAVLVVIAIIIIGLVFDIIGLAFATCDNVAFVSQAAKRDKTAKRAIILLKNATKVTSFCSDVIGDICGIVSGSIGALIVAKIALSNETIDELAWAIGISAVIAAVTVASKAAGKNIAIRNSREIVGMIAKILSPFWRIK